MSILTMCIVVFVMVQVSMFCSTIWMHRYQTHRSVQLNWVVGSAMHFWIAALTGISPPKWIAVHRLHHQHEDTAKDPTSPDHLGFLKVMLSTYWLYWKTADKPTVAKYAKDYRPDWVDRSIVARVYGLFGLGALVLIFGWYDGPIIWLSHNLVNLFMFGLLNSANHSVGWRSKGSKHKATNIAVLAYITAGEALHANHHDDEASPCFGKHWWQIDLGWIVILALTKAGLATLRRPAP